MLVRMARAVIRRRREVLLASVIALALAGVGGFGVFSKLAGGGFTDPGSGSQRAADALAGQFHAGQANFVLIAESRGSIDAPAAAAGGEALAADLARQPDVTGVVDYWSAGRPASMRSDNGRDALITAHITGSDDQVTSRAGMLVERFRGQHDGLTVAVAGSGPVYSAVTERVQHDLTKAELIAFPVTFVLLVLVFGGVVAALMPLAVGVVAIICTLLVLRLIAAFTDVSVYSLNITTGLGLGLAIDYSLFIITRYREELARRGNVEQALVASVASAGRTVLFSALTVAMSLSALLVFPMYFLRSFAYAGIAVVLLAAVVAAVVLPALLAVLGARIDALTLFRRRPAEAEHGFWRRLAEGVMRRPVLTGGAVVVVLLVLGSPFLSIRFGLPDDRVLPRSDPAQQASQLLRTAFPGNVANALQVVDTTRPAGAVELERYAAELSRLGRVVAVQSAAGTFVAGVRTAAPGPGSSAFSGPDGSWVQVDTDAEGYSAAGEHLVEQIRAVPAPAPVVVGGASAQLLDTEHAIGAQLPLAAAIVALAMLLVLFLFTGSLVIPLKALVLNLLSLSASFGAMVFIFQQGHLLPLVGEPIVTGTIDTSMPLLMFCVAFGLSMDYEVFLLSRIRETYLGTGDNRRAVAVGLERTGRLVTAAAGLIAVVWLTFVTSGITFLKLLGLGMALAVIVDATLVRGVLVPAFMRLAGDWNWWAPAPLRRWHARHGLAESPAALPPAAYPSPEPTAAAS
jgi:RND superfamily putative drug exporter